MSRCVFFAVVCLSLAVGGSPIPDFALRGDRVESYAMKIDRNPKYVGDRPLNDIVNTALLCICQQVVQTRGVDGPAADNVCAEKWCAKFQRENTCGPTTTLGQLEQCVVSNKPDCYLNFPDFTSTATTMQYLSAIQQCYDKTSKISTSTTTTPIPPSDNPIDSIYW